MPYTKKSQQRRSLPSTKRRKDVQRTVPTSDLWRSWKPMQFCTVNDSRNGEKITFRLEEDILVLNHDWKPDKNYDMCDSWVGKIVDIRGNSPRNTWVIVQWYYSGKDIAGHERVAGTPVSMIASCYGKFERSLSQDRQVISTQSINGKAIVMDYDETSFQQEPIPAECFYTRRAYNSLFGSVKPNVLENITCICGRPYNPDESDPMHLCPRFGCKRWYHQSCLHENGFMSTKSPDERTKDFLDVPPAWVPRVPPDLLRIACTPIVRGGPTHGVVGNVKTVCEAREWAQQYASMPRAECRPGLLMNDITLDRWLDGLEGIEVEDLVYPDDECGSADFLARRRIQNEEAPPPFICPACEKPV